ncbi:MAG: hypothetical protein ABI760_01630 [Ferruginibacter sp.]
MVKLFLLPLLILFNLMFPAFSTFESSGLPAFKAKSLPCNVEKKTVISVITNATIESAHPVKNNNSDRISQGNTGNYVGRSLSMKQSQLIHTDTLIIPSGDSGISKVVISNGTEGIEFTPYITQINGGLIQPVNRVTNKGVPTSFYLPDSSSWSFYTNATQRMIIQGDGKIVTTSPLLINNVAPDSESALRVNGIARFDSSISIRADSDSLGYISIDRNVKHILEPDDGISPYTFIPTAWANGGNIPALRIRHPRNVTNIPPFNKSIYRDFLIVPYQYGTAIQFNGVVECWVGEWSIHRGNFYYDVEGKKNGWGGVLWVGDDEDVGGVRATARYNLPKGGNVNYGEISVEKFSGAPHGDFRLRLPSTQDTFQFVYGERGSENIVAKISNNGLFIPKVNSVANLLQPEQAQLLFDSTDKQFKGYNGTQWLALTDNGLMTGSATQSANGTTQVFLIAHGLSSIPAYFNVLATSPESANISYVTADNINLIIHYATAPVAGSGNLSWNWQIKK